MSSFATRLMFSALTTEKKIVHPRSRSLNILQQLTLTKTFPRLTLVKHFPVVATCSVFSRACHHLHAFPPSSHFSPWNIFPRFCYIFPTCHVSYVFPLVTRYMFSRAYHPLKVSPHFSLFKGFLTLITGNIISALAKHFIILRLQPATHGLAHAIRSLHLILHLPPVAWFFLPLPPVKALTKQEKEWTKVWHTLLFLALSISFSAFTVR